MASDRLKEFDDFDKDRLKPTLSKKYALDGYGPSLRQVLNRFDQVIDYNVPHGKKMRGLCTYDSVNKLIASGANKFLQEADQDKLLEQSKAVGWCIEFVR